MNNIGVGFILYDNGWACSNDVVFDVEHDPVIDANNKKNLITTNTLKFSAIFEGVGEVVKGLKVFCLFKADNQKFAFIGCVRGKSGNLTIIDLLGKSEKINEIIAKIKQLGGK